MPDQLIEVVGYDPDWPSRFAEQRSVVEELLSRWLAGPVEHIGSTAVPGLRAKPVVDMLAPVSALADARAAIPVLVEAGWWDWPDDPAGHYRLWFLRPLPEARTHHLHVLQQDDPHTGALLEFRDALRADAGLCGEYGDLKERLATEHRDDRNAYTNAKADFVARVLSESGVELPARDLLPE